MQAGYIAPIEIIKKDKRDGIMSSLSQQEQAIDKKEKAKTA
ncbi:hypothetical protein [Bacillus inaquosorum]